MEYGLKNVPSKIFFVCKKFKISDLLPEVRTSFKVSNFLLALWSLTTICSRAFAFEITWRFLDALAGYKLNVPDCGK
jgi:hypothetical protein